jgi:hypothetical protein
VESVWPNIRRRDPQETRNAHARLSAVALTFGLGVCEGQRQGRCHTNLDRRGARFVCELNTELRISANRTYSRVAEPRPGEDALMAAAILELCRTTGDIAGAIRAM